LNVRNPTLLLALALVSVPGCAGNRPPAFCDSYREPADPSGDPSAEWAGVDDGLHLSVGSIDHHYFKGEVPDLEERREWSGTAWRGEKVSAQVVVWASQPYHQLEVELSDFVGDGGAVLPADLAQARFVRYVLTDEFADGCGRRNPKDYPVHLFPDGLEESPCSNNPSNSVRPIWLTLDVPGDATPGLYTSRLEVRAQRHNPVAIRLELEVLPRTLPPPSEWQFHLDLWQNPYAVARVEGVEPWSDAHWAALRPLMKMLADAGQKVITTTVTDAPWDGQTFDPFESMVTWKSRADGGWEFDYTVFDQWVEFMMELGVTKQINAYSLIPWSDNLTYVDEATGEEVSEEVEPGSDRYVELWTPFLVDFRSHLEEKGWNAITNIAMDESGPEDMRRMLDMMNQLAPEFGIALADNSRSFKLFPDRIKDLCVAYADTIEEPDLEYRRAQGYPSTYYVCCADPFPNTFTFSPPAEAAFIGWYAVAAGFDGFLRWSYNSWVEDPLRDSRFRTWPAGDTYIVYPGAMSSIRFERLVEGIQDAEKIRILRQDLEAESTDEAKGKLEALEALLRRFDIREKPEDTNGLLDQGKALLEELSRG
jgi:hypothetical protein